MRFVFAAILGILLPPFYRLLFLTLRLVQYGREPMDAIWDSPSSLVVVFWHDEFFPVMAVRKNIRTVVMASPSRDGEFLNKMLARLGIETVRGSSSRKGMSALREMIRLLETELVAACIAIDGPRGPRHRIKPGALFLASHSGVPLVPLRMFMERAYIFKSWDRFQIPLPFSRVRYVFGEPYRLPPNLDDAGLQAAVDDLQARMDALDNEGFVTVKGEKTCQ